MPTDQQIRDSLREKLAKAEAERHDTPKGRARRKLAARVRRIRDHLERVIQRIKGAKKPNWSGHVPVLSSTGVRVVREANRRGLVVTSTIDGTHSATSYHYQRRAIDFGVNWSTGVSTTWATHVEIGFQGWLAAEYPSAREIFGPDGYYIKDGVRHAGMFPGHADHVHFAV